MTEPAQKLPVARDRAKILTPRPPSPPPVRWNHRKWGTLEDPIHKSQLSTLVGEYACTKQFQLDRVREVTGSDERDTCSGKTEMGTAAHETIARALRHDATREAVLAGRSTATLDQVRRVVLEEFERACAGREVVWYGKHEQEGVLGDVTAMVFGLLHDLSRHVADVVLVEAGFIAPLGDLWLEGHTDLVYRPRGASDALAFTDWKTGAQRPHQLVLDHGYESGIYSVALERGLFLPVEVLRQWRADVAAAPLDPPDRDALASARTERDGMHAALRGLARRHQRGEPLAEGAVTFGRFPDVIRLTHLADYVPYEKKGTKAVERPEDLEHWSRVLGRPVAVGEKVNYEKGQMRGAAWLRVRRCAEDVQRLERLLKAVVGWTRFGLFVEAVSEKCTRCAYKTECLTSGYALRGDEAKELTAALRGLDLDALGEISTND